MEFKQIVMQRYAARKFDGRRIDDAKVEELLEMIRYACSGLNLQPWKIKVIADQALKDKLVHASHGQQQVSNCSHLLVFCANTDVESHMNMIVDQMRKSGAPEESIKHIEEMAKGVQTMMTKEQLLAFVQAQVYLPLSNAIHGAKALGFDSCPMTGFDPAEYARILGLPSNLIPTAVCPIGYAVDAPTPKFRLPKEEIFF